MHFILMKKGGFRDQIPESMKRIYVKKGNKYEVVLPFVYVLS